MSAMKFTKLAVVVIGDLSMLGKDRLEKAERFYARIGALLRKRGFEVQFDPGLPHTWPVRSHLCVAHSRGGDRLSSSHSKVKVAIAVPGLKGALWHPADNQRDWPNAPNTPNEFHFVLTSEMRAALGQAALRAGYIAETGEAGAR